MMEREPIIEGKRGGRVGELWRGKEGKGERGEVIDRKHKPQGFESSLSPLSYFYLKLILIVSVHFVRENERYNSISDVNKILSF